MNGNEYILAFAEIPDDLISTASDDTAVRKAFRQYRSRRNKMISALCCCIVVAAVAVGSGLQNRFGKTPQIISNNTDDNTTAPYLPKEPDETEPQATQPGVTPQETESIPEETTQRTHETPSDTTEQPASTAETPTAGHTEPSTKAPEIPASDESGPTDDSVIWGETGGTSASCYVTWNGKQVGYELWEVLQMDTSGKTIAIVASPTINLQFPYKGKTIAQYETEAEEQKELVNKLRSLLEDGEALKYGEALYTTGTPDGEIWAKSLYEQKLAYYGTQLLAKYIADGVFFSDRVEADIPLAEADTSARDAYNEAVASFYSQTAAAAASAFSASGLYCSVTERGGGVLFFASAERFADLTAPDNAEWFYYLAQNTSGNTPVRS